jgi:hypothetical protein
MWCGTISKNHEAQDSDKVTVTLICDTTLVDAALKAITEAFESHKAEILTWAHVEGQKIVDKVYLDDLEVLARSAVNGYSVNLVKRRQLAERRCAARWLEIQDIDPWVGVS